MPHRRRRIRAAAPREATRAQRIALLVGLLVVAWLALQLFASVLLPFVAASGDRLFPRPAGEPAHPRRACRAGRRRCC